MPHFRHARPSFPPHGFGDTFEDLRGRLDVLGALHQHEVTMLRSENARLWSQILHTNLVSSTGDGDVVGSRPHSCDQDAPGARPESVSHIGPSITGTPTTSAIGGDKDTVLCDSLLAKSGSFTLTCEARLHSAAMPAEQASPERGASAVEQPEPGNASDSAAGGEPRSPRAWKVSEAISGFDLPASPHGAQKGDARSSSGLKDMSQRASSFLLQPVSCVIDQDVVEEDPTLLNRLVSSKAFEICFGFLIIMNSATMGMQAQVFVKGQPDSFTEVCEQFFNVFFTIELTLRMRVYGLSKYLPINRDQMYNFIDALVVIITSILSGWLLMLLTMAMPTAFDFRGRDAANVRIITLLRAVRLVRLVRVVQRLEFFKEAWILLRGLSDSVRTLFWTLVFIASITYMFAVFGMVLISRDLQWLYDELPSGLRKVGEECDAELGVTAGKAPDLCLFQLYFVSMDQVMMTLIQLLTMDDWNSMVKPMLHYKPWCWVYFYCYIAVAVFVLMNLVTAIIVDNALKSSRVDEDRELRDKEEERLAELRNISNLFDMMDTDGDGTLCWDEFKEAFDDPIIVNKWKLLDFRQEDCRELFRLLDNGDGNIDTKEFFDGLRKCKGEAQSKDIFRLQKMLERMEARNPPRGPNQIATNSLHATRTRQRLSRHESEASHDRGVVTASCS